MPTRNNVETCHQPLQRTVRLSLLNWEKIWKSFSQASSRLSSGTIIFVNILRKNVKESNKANVKCPLGEEAKNRVKRDTATTNATKMAVEVEMGDVNSRHHVASPPSVDLFQRKVDVGMAIIVNFFMVMVIVEHQTSSKDVHVLIWANVINEIIVVMEMVNVSVPMVGSPIVGILMVEGSAVVIEMEINITCTWF